MTSSFKVRSIVLSLGATLCLLALSACNNLSTPESTVSSAYSDIQSGDLENFQATLSGEALTQYGTQSGLAELQRKLAGSTPVMGEAKKLSGSANQDGSGWTATYDVPTNLLDLHVVCQTTQDAAPSPAGSDADYATFCTIDSITST